MDSGSVAWILTSMAMVIFMTPGLALFYGGMVRSKNLLSMLMMNIICMGVVSILWAVIGFSLAGGQGSFMGGFDHAFMAGINEGDSLLNFVFALSFAIITPALISGAIADRMRFSAWLAFICAWSVLVYSPVAHWVWGEGGWIRDGWLEQHFASLDFAGGTVVHVNAGAAALVAAIMLGKRRGWPKTPMPPHSLHLTILGAGILWFGWFGFNAGSALAADDSAILAAVNTQLAAGAAMVGWLIIERIKTGHATTLGAASGAVAGLVAITPGAAYVTGMMPIVIGLCAGALCFYAISLKHKLGFDDALDVVGVHLVGGLFGSLALGFVANNAVFTDHAEGLFFGGGFDLLIGQLISNGAAFAYSAGLTFVILKVVDALVPGGIRATEEEEMQGLDLSYHAETAYDLV
jgi:Amt family ammonium transporter